MKTYELRATAAPELFRVVDRNGDWTHYFHEPTKRYLRAVNYILHRGFAMPELQRYLSENNPEAIKEKLARASDRGDAIHQAINLLLLSAIPIAERSTLFVLAEDNKTKRQLTTDEWDALLSFAEFWNRHEPILYQSEYPVFNLNFGYAGTFDAIVKLTKNCGNRYCKCDEFIGKVGLLDWKSGGGIYDNYGAQVAAYAKAENLPVAVEYTGIVRIGTNHKTTGGYCIEFYDQNETQVHSAEFLAAITIADASYTPFTAEEIKDIPDIVTLTITKPPIAEVTPPAKALAKKPAKTRKVVKTKAKKAA